MCRNSREWSGKMNRTVETRLRTRRRLSPPPQFEPTDLRGRLPRRALAGEIVRKKVRFFCRLLSVAVASHCSSRRNHAGLAAPVGSCRFAPFPLRAGGRRFESCTAHFTSSTAAGVGSTPRCDSCDRCSTCGRVLSSVLSPSGRCLALGTCRPRTGDLRLANSVRHRSCPVSAGRPTTVTRRG
jgi:hypothetical protein